MLTAVLLSKIGTGLRCRTDGISKPSNIQTKKSAIKGIKRLTEKAINNVPNLSDYKMSYSEGSLLIRGSKKYPHTLDTQYKLQRTSKGNEVQIIFSNRRERHKIISLKH